MRKLLFLLVSLYSLTAISQSRAFGFNNRPARVGLLNLSNGGSTAILADAEDAVASPYPFDVWTNTDPGGSPSISKAVPPVLKFGAKAYKFYVEEGQADYAGGVRSEISMLDDNNGVGYQNYERWVGFSIFIPSGWVDENNVNVYNISQQFHNYPTGAEIDKKSAFEFCLFGTKWSYTVRSSPTTANNSTAVEELAGDYNAAHMNLSNPTVIKNAWTDIVIHLKFKNGNSAVASDWNQARAEIWINGTKCADYTGPMGYAHAQPPFFKIGNYAYFWSSDNYPDYVCCINATSNTYYIDQIRVGNSTSNYYSVFPGFY